MPTWAAEIVSQNNSDLNFKGFAVGNPYNNFYSGYLLFNDDKSLELMTF